MKVFSFSAAVFLTFVSWGLKGQNLDQVRKMEASGDVAGAHTALAHAVDTSPGSIPALTNYAEFLEAHGDPSCREVYTRLLEALKKSGNTARAAVITRRLALLDSLEGTGG